MTAYTLATVPSAFRFHEIGNDEVFTSLAGAVQVANRTGTRLGLSLNWRRAGSGLRTLRGELAALNGMRHRLWVPMSLLDYVKGGVGAGIYTTSGAHSAGATAVALQGLPSSTPNILLPGDFIEIGGGSYGQLVQVTAALTSSGTTGTVNIWPPLNKARANAENVRVSSPGGTFIKMSDSGVGSEPMPSDWFCEVSAEFEQDVLV